MIYKAKKSMGQNFLKSQEALRTMCSAGDVNDQDIILEIGPGKGALTEKLLEKAKCVIAIEKDNELFEFLELKFSNEIKNEKLILINGDILDLDPKNYNLKKGEYKIIANIPYNITGSIFKKFLSCDNQPERMILLVQKEVADRIVARDGKESILSLSVKVYGTPRYVMKVHKRFFSPSPKVDSAIIAITNISKDNFNKNMKEERFFHIIKTAFSHKRKILRKNLEGLPFFEVGLQKIDRVFKDLNIDLKSRAEDIQIEKWIEIYNKLSTEI